MESSKKNKKDKIKQFLKDFKNCWDGKVADERSDEKNNNTLAILGITPKHRVELIKSLNYKNFYRGPTPDHAKPSEECWEFGKWFKGREIYIKLKIYKINDRKRGKALSFHFAERSITYPYLKGG